jgi:hypothetical protein
MRRQMRGFEVNDSDLQVSFTLNCHITRPSAMLMTFDQSKQTTANASARRERDVVAAMNVKS